MALLSQSRSLAGEFRSELTPRPPVSDARWQLVQRVAASQFFTRGPKLRAFFLYICENSLLGRPENLTTQLIGVRVFGRHPDYLPSEDNIVRVEARELRKRLSAYFTGEGRDEPIVIEIPKGSYLPVFVERELIEPEEAPQVALPVSAGSIRPERRWLVPVLAAALAVSLCVILWQAFSSKVRMQHQAFLAGLNQTSSSSADFSIYDDLLGSLGANSRRDALLVLSNPHLITYSVSQSAPELKDGGSEYGVSIPATMRNSFAPLMKERDRNSPFQVLHLTGNAYTGIGEAVAAFHIGRLADLLGRRVRLTQARFLNWEHIEKQDLILLGGPHSNDWTYQSDARANFRIDSSSIVNTNPLPGEQASYKADATTDYALIQKLTTPYNFETLTVAGISSPGTAAAGEFLADPEKMTTVHGAIRAVTSGRGFPRTWEVLLKVSVRGGLPVGVEVAAIRPGKPQSS